MPEQDWVTALVRLLTQIGKPREAEAKIVAGDNEGQAMIDNLRGSTVLDMAEQNKATGTVYGKVGTEIKDTGTLFHSPFRLSENGGMYVDNKNKEIYASSPQAFLHELGHFLHYNTGEKKLPEVKGLDEEHIADIISGAYLYPKADMSKINIQQLGQLLRLIYNQAQ